MGAGATKNGSAEASNGTQSTPQAVTKYKPIGRSVPASHGKELELRQGGSYTAGEVIEYIGMCRMHYHLLLLLGAVALVHGMDTAFFTFIPMFAGCTFNASILTQTYVSVVYLVGLSLGSLVFGFLSDITGRKAAFVSAIVLLLITSIAALYTVTIAVLYVFRFVSGFAMGGLAIRTTWMFECLPNRAHVKALLAMVALWQLGMILEVPLLMAAASRWIFVVVGIHIPLTIVVIFLIMMPESPRFLSEAEFLSDALHVLDSIALGKGMALPDIAIISEREKKRRTREQNGGSSTSDSENDSAPQKGKRFMKEILRSGERLRTTLLLGIAWFCVYFSFFGHQLATVEWFAMLQGSSEHASVLSKVPLYRCVVFKWKDYVALLSISACALPGLLLVVSLVDVVGRRKALVISSVVGGIVLPFSLIPGLDRIALTIMLSIQRALISATLQILFVYTAEVYPTHLRSFANGLLLAFGMIGAIVTPFISQSMLRQVPIAAISAFCGAYAVTAIACYFLPLESHGKLLED